MENRPSADVQYNKMVNTPVWKLVTTLAIPTIISMMVTAIYNTADTFFVSQLGTSASAAVGIVFPIMSIIQACGFTLGMGSGSLLSIKLGQKKNDEASTISSTAFFTALGVGLLITVFGNSFANGILSLVGASDAVLPYAKDYARYIFWGAPFMCASFVLNNDLRAEGKAFFSMIALTSGGIINLFLDPIFIFDEMSFIGLPLKGFGMGISGAAVATLISQLISFSVLLSFFIRKKAICQMNITFYAKNPSVLGKIVLTGLPSMARQGLASIAAIMLNKVAAGYGDSAVAGMAITSKLVMFLASMIIGVGQGFSPVSGYNFGAKRYDRVKKAFWFMVSSGFVLMTIFASVFVIFAPQIIASFRDDPEVIAVGAVALRWQALFLPLHPFIIGTNMLMQSTRHIKQAAFLSMNRQGVYFLPAVIILPALFGLFGLEISQAVADFFSMFTAIPYLVWFYKKYPNQQEIA